MKILMLHKDSWAIEAIPYPLIPLAVYFLCPCSILQEDPAWRVRGHWRPSLVLPKLLADEEAQKAAWSLQ